MSCEQKQFFPLMTAGTVILIAALVVPHFSQSLNFSRLYHIALIFIAPCFVYGIAQIHSGLNRMFSFVVYNVVHEGEKTKRRELRICKRWLFAAFILASYLLFTSGCVWAASSDTPTSLIFDRERLRTIAPSQRHPYMPSSIYYFVILTVPQDIAGADWLLSYSCRSQLVCSDDASTYHVLNSYGDRPRNDPEIYYGCDYSRQYVFLSAFYTRYGIVIYGPIEGDWVVYNMYEELTLENRVYSSGSATTYQ
jgi:uncharacterized membrane protein